MGQERPPLSLGQLEKAAERLRPIERRILVLSARERLSNRAIAARLALSPAKVERILARAIHKLADEIEREERRGRKTEGTGGR